MQCSRKASLRKFPPPHFQSPQRTGNNGGHRQPNPLACTLNYRSPKFQHTHPRTRRPASWAIAFLTASVELRINPMRRYRNSINATSGTFLGPSPLREINRICLRRDRDAGGGADVSWRRPGFPPGKRGVPPYGPRGVLGRGTRAAWVVTSPGPRDMRPRPATAGRQSAPRLGRGRTAGFARTAGRDARGPVRHEDRCTSERESLFDDFGSHFAYCDGDQCR